MAGGIFKSRWWLLLLATALLYADFAAQPGLAQLRDRYRLMSRPAKHGVPPEYVMLNSALGGFRGLLLTTLWVRAQNMKNDGQFYEMVDIYNLITKLQPNHHAAWAFQAWDLSYNVSVEFQDYGERVYWVFRGVDLLRLQGIPNNPAIPELCAELSWIFQHKLGAESDEAHPLYRFYLARQVEQAFDIDPANARLLNNEKQTDYLAEMALLPRTREEMLLDPEFAALAEKLRAAGFDIFDDSKLLYGWRSRPPAVQAIVGEDPKLLALLHRANLWKISERIRTRLGMEPAEMYRLAGQYGPIDWRIPFAHALYWSERALSVYQDLHPGDSAHLHHMRVRQALIAMVHQGRVFLADDGLPYYVPEYSFYNPLIDQLDRTYKDLYDSASAKNVAPNLGGFLAGYVNFLKDAVFQCYFDERLTQAERIMAKLREVSGEKRFEMSATQFVVENFKEYFGTASRRDATNWIAAMTGTAYMHLSIGDLDQYNKRKAMVEFYYREYCLKRWDPNSRRNPDDTDYGGQMPKLDDIRSAVAVQIVAYGADGRFSPQMAYNLLNALDKLEPAVGAAVRSEIDQIRKAQESPDPSNAAPAAAP